MKNKIYLSALLLLAFGACSEEETSSEPSPAQIPNNSSVKNTFVGEPWTIQSAGAYYHNEFEPKIEMVLSKETNLDLCKDGLPHSSYFSVFFLPRTGRFEFGNSNELFYSGILDTARRNDNPIFLSQPGPRNYLQIDVLDTVGKGNIKGSFHFSFTSATSNGTTDDEVAGSFDLEFCRDHNFIAFLNQDARGTIGDQTWASQSGIADEGSNEINLYNFMFNSPCHAVQDSFPRLQINPSSLDLGNYRSANTGSNNTLAFYYYLDENNFRYCQGGMEILSIDTVSNTLSARIDAFTQAKNANDPRVEINGNISVSYCK